jgi:protein SCO1/2
MLQRKYIWLVLTAIMLLVGYGLVNRKPAFQNPVIDPPLIAADFSLPDDHGSPFRMSAMRGKLVLLYFGFTNCPDECPLTMAHFKQVFEALGPESKNIQVVMVSTDPLRDTPQSLRDFLGKFNPTFIGIPGTPDQLAQVWQDYGVQVLDGGETHSSYTYVIDQKGMQRLTISPNTSPDAIAADLKILLGQ